MLQCHYNARVAQRWSTSLPRRGSRVRFPSRALGTNKKDIQADVLFICFEAQPCLEVRLSPLRSGPRKAEVPRTSCAVSRSFYINLRCLFSRIGYPIYLKLKTILSACMCNPFEPHFQDLIQLIVHQNMKKALAYNAKKIKI